MYKTNLITMDDTNIPLKSIKLFADFCWLWLSEQRFFLFLPCNKIVLKTVKLYVLEENSRGKGPIKDHALFSYCCVDELMDCFVAVLLSHIFSWLLDRLEVRRSTYWFDSTKTQYIKPSRGNTLEFIYFNTKNYYLVFQTIKITVLYTRQ